MFARLLEGDGPARAPLLGELMYQSHASYSACGLGSPGTDRLVELARAAGPGDGIFGAKITGGGSGGTVAILARRDAEDAVQALASAYGKETGRRPHVFSGSSSGAGAFGHLRLS
jgi:L-arabinokinase